MYAYKHYNPDAKRPPPPPEPTVTTPDAPPTPVPIPSGPMSFSLSSLFSDPRTTKRLAQRYLLPAGTREILAPKSSVVTPEELVRAGGGDIDIFGGIAKDVAALKMDKRNQEKMRRILAMLEDMADQWEDSKGGDRDKKGKKRRSKVVEADDDDEDDDDDSSRHGRGRKGHARHCSDPSGDPTRTRRKSSRRDDSSSDDDGDEQSTVKPEGKGGKLRRVKSDLDELVNPFDPKKGYAKAAKGGNMPSDKELRSMGKDEMKALLKRLEADRDKAKPNTRDEAKSSSSSDATKANKGKSTKPSSSTKEKAEDPLKGLTKDDLAGLSRDELKALMDQVEKDKPSMSSAKAPPSGLMALTKEDLAKMSPEELQKVMQKLEKEKGKAGAKPKDEAPEEPLGPDPLAGYSKEHLKAMDPDKLKRMMKKREVWKAKRDAPSAGANTSKTPASDIGPDPMAGFTKDELAKLDPADLKKLTKLREAWKAKRDAGRTVAKPKVDPATPADIEPDPLAGFSKEQLKALDPADLKKLMKTREVWKAKRDAPSASSSAAAKATPDIGPDPLAGYSKEDLEALDPEKLKRLMKKREAWKALRDAKPAAVDVPAALKGISKADLQDMSRDELKALMRKCDPSGSAGATTSGKVADHSPQEPDIEAKNPGCSDEDDDLAAFLPPKRGSAAPTRPSSRRPPVSRHQPHPPRQDSNTHTPQNFDWPDRDEIAQHGQTSRPRQFANEPLRRSDSPETESLVSDLDPPSPLLDSGFNIAFPQTPGHEPGGAGMSGLIAILPTSRLPPTDAPAGGAAEAESAPSLPPKFGYADEFLHPERHPEVAQIPRMSYFPPVPTPPIPLPSSQLRDGPVEAPGMSNPLLSRVISSLHECFISSKDLDEQHAKLKGKSDPTPEHRILKGMHHWLEKQLGPLQGAVDLFSHADADDMLEMMKSLAKLHGYLELPHLENKQWDPRTHQALASKYARVKQLLLRMAAGAVLHYMMSRIWHLSSGMLRTLEHCLDVVQNEQGSPESVLAILPRIRGQLHSATRERLAHPEAQQDVKEASDLMDILYEIAVDALPTKLVTTPSPPPSGPPLAPPSIKKPASNDTVRMKKPCLSKCISADLVPAPSSRPQMTGGLPISSSKSLTSSGDDKELRQVKRNDVKRDSHHDARRPEELVERLQLVERQQQAQKPAEEGLIRKDPIAQPSSAWSVTNSAAESSMASNNLLGLSSPPRDTPEVDAISTASSSSGRRPSVPEPRTPRSVARPIDTAPSLDPMAQVERNLDSSPPSAEDGLDADNASITDYSPLQDLLENYFPGSGASLTKQLAASRRTSTMAAPAGHQVDQAPTLPLSPPRTVRIASPRTLYQPLSPPTTKRQVTFQSTSPSKLAPLLPSPRPQPTRGNAVMDSDTLLLERPREERQRKVASETSPIRPAPTIIQSASSAAATPLVTSPPSQTIAAKLLTTSSRKARRGRPSLRTRTSLLRSSSIDTSTAFAPTLASPLRESAVVEDTSSTLEMISDSSSMTTIHDREEVVERVQAVSEDVATVSSLTDGELSVSPPSLDTLADVEAIAEREAQEELESLEAEDRVPVLDSDAILADRADRLADMTDSPEARIMTAAEREFADLTSPAVTLLDGTIPGPRVFSSADVRLGEISYQDVPTAIRGGVPRVEVTPGAIQNTDGEAIALEDEDVHLQMGETLIDGTGRMWNKNGLVEPGQDDEGDDILYDEDYAQLKRDNYGQMPVYMPWERDRIDDLGASSPLESLSEDGYSLSVASDFTNASPTDSPVDSLNDPEDVELELGEPGLDEIALMEREGYVSGAGTPVPYRDMTTGDLPRVDDNT